MSLLVVLLMAAMAQAALPSEQPRWALGVSLRDSDASSLWRIGPRFTYGLTLRTNVFTHIADLRLWTLDIDYRLTVKVLHHRAKEVSWFTFLEAGHILHEVDYPYYPDDSPHSETKQFFDKGATSLAAGTGIAWVPHERLGCFMRWGILYQYREGSGENLSWIELDKIRLTGFWML